MAKQKISTKAIIREVKAKAGGSDIKFGGLKFTSGQMDKLSDMAQEKTEVTLTIEAVQESLPGME